MFIIAGGNRCDCRHVDNHCQGTPQNERKGKAKPARTEKQCRTQIPDPVSRLITVSDSLGLTELIESTGSIIKGAAFFVERRFIEPIFLSINLNLDFALVWGAYILYKQYKNLAG